MFKARVSFFILLVICTCCSQSSKRAEEPKLTSTDSGNTTDSTTFKDLEDGKWIDEAFLDNLDSTRSLDSALLKNSWPILVFTHTRKGKQISQHSPHTFLSEHDSGCSASITSFTSDNRKDTYAASLASQSNSCLMGAFEAEKYSSEEGIEVLSIAFKKSADGDEEKTETVHHNYKRFRAGLVQVLNKYVVAGSYADATGKKYVFYEDRESKQKGKGAFDDDYAFACNWNDEEFTYIIGVDEKNVIHLFLYDDLKNVKKHYAITATQNTLTLKADPGTEVVKLTREIK